MRLFRKPDSAASSDPVERMEALLEAPLRAETDRPYPPIPWRGRRIRGGGYASLMPTVDEFFGTSSQVCGGFWPFGTDMALPVEGVPVGRSLATGAGVCCDPISWFKAGIIKQPSMFLLGLPAIGKSTFVRRQVLGLSALGMNAIIPGDLKPDYASLVGMLGGQVIRLGAGIGVVNPLDPGDLHYALQRLDGKARKDLADYYNDTRCALMEVLLTIMRTGRESDADAGQRGVTARESDILSVAVRVLYERCGGDPQPPVVADLRDLLASGPREVREAAVYDDPGNDELYAAQVRGLLADLHGFANRMTKFGRLFGEQTTARIDLSRPVDFDISALAQSGDDVVAAVLATTWT
ncbi:ATPase, partial [Bifidobacterium saguini DSM 23967]